MIWTATILVCLLSVPHEQCTEGNALSVIRSPVLSFASETACQMGSMTYAATNVDLDGSVYPVVKCEGP